MNFAPSAPDAAKLRRLLKRETGKKEEMPNVPTFIKPSRTMDEIQPLSQAATILNGLRGIETSVVLDLNVLNMMRSVISGGTTLDEANLSGLVHFFNSNPVFITPGFAFGEADKAYV